jgi:hypothetical protein
MEIIGYSIALIVGITLGLIGSGGSILAVPVLAYMFSLDEKIATAYSLFIVGVAALVGGLKQNQMNNVDWRTALIFGFPAVLGVWLVRFYIVPELPDILFYIGDFSITRRMGMFGFFAVLMFLAAFSMLKNNHTKSGSGMVQYNYPLILLEGLFFGGVSGFIGAGGGFLIVPALVVLANLEIKIAIGTSLMIVAIKSILGFLLADAITVSIDWVFLLAFTVLTILGIIIGVKIGGFIDSNRLKTGFSYFLMVMAVFIFFIEFYVEH